MSLAPSSSESYHICALNICKSHLKKNREKYVILTDNILEKKDFLLYCAEFHVIYVKKLLTKIYI